MGALDIGTVLLRLAAAMLAGLAIGFERERHEKAAGLRTLALVSTGSAVFVLSTLALVPAEAGRMAAGIATGIGFLGAGAILRENGEVIGLTTAATVWVAAALGISAALGAFALTALGVVLALFVLSVLRMIDFTRVQEDERSYHINYTATTWDEAEAAECLVAAGVRAALVGVSRTEHGISADWRVVGTHRDHAQAVARLCACPTVETFSMRML